MRKIEAALQVGRIDEGEVRPVTLNRIQRWIGRWGRIPRIEVEIYHNQGEAGLSLFLF